MKEIIDSIVNTAREALKNLLTAKTQVIELTASLLKEKEANLLTLRQWEGMKHSLEEMSMCMMDKGESQEREDYYRYMISRFLTAFREAQRALKDGVNVQGALSELSGCEDNLQELANDYVKPEALAKFRNMRR